MGCVIKYKGQSIPEEQFLQYLNKQIAINNLFNENQTLANEVYEALGINQNNTLISSTLFEAVPNITESQIKDIYDNYVSLMNRARNNKEISFSTFKNLIQKYQVIKKGDNYIFGHFDNENSNKISQQEQQIQKQQAQQLYSKYLDSLNKPNTNPILKDNQQEQVKKFVELQERLNNKEFLEGAKNVYESSEDLKSFGTQEKYNDYIARVSLGIIKNPSSGEYNYNSKVKDIVYHGSKSSFEKFSKDFLGSNLGHISPDSKLGFFFSNLENAKGFGKNIFTTILNMSNPKIVTEEEYTKLSEGTREFKNKVFFQLLNEAKQENKDSLLADFRVSDYMGSKQYVVFEPEQIHILSSKKDIEGFKEFVNNKSYQKLEEEEGDSSPIENC